MGYEGLSMWREYWNKPKEGYPSKAEQLEKEEWKRKGKLEDEKFIVSQVPKTQILVDVGCGSARFQPHLKDKTAWYIGCDFSREMLRLAKQKGDIDLVRCDAERLPFREFKGVAICIDVLRHLPSLKGYGVIRELLRTAEIIMFNITEADKAQLYGDKHHRNPNQIADHPFTLQEMRAVLTDCCKSRVLNYVRMPPQPPYKTWDRLLITVDKSTDK
mgnify:CR=1 FL=1